MTPEQLEKALDIITIDGDFDNSTPDECKLIEKAARAMLALMKGDRFKVVPVEPTEEMILEGILYRHEFPDQSCAPIFKAMLSAVDPDIINQILGEE